MKCLKKYSFMMITVLTMIAIIFVPGAVIKVRDREALGSIHVEKVSSGRNALLAAMSLEERIRLYCDYNMNSALLFEYVTDGNHVSSQREAKNQVMIEYAYTLEDEQSFEKYLEELEELAEQKVLPKVIIDEKKTSVMTGERMYLYSKKEDKGAVFVRLELYLKNNLNARFIIDEESGKVIGFFLEGELMKKEPDLQVTMGEKYLSYLGIPFERVETGKEEQCYCTKEKEYYYRMFHIGNEMGAYPLK